MLRRPVSVEGLQLEVGASIGVALAPDHTRAGVSLLRFADAAGYTMVKTTWFNGLRMPSIVVRRLDGTVEVVREFGYDDFKRSLS